MILIPWCVYTNSLIIRSAHQFSRNLTRKRCACLYSSTNTPTPSSSGTTLTDNTQASAYSKKAGNKNEQASLSASIDQYWNNVNTYFNDDDTRKLAEARTGIVSPDTIKDLILNAIKIKRSPTSDILPNVITSNMLDSYRRSDDKFKSRFFRVLYQDFDVDKGELASAMSNMQHEIEKHATAGGGDVGVGDGESVRGSTSYSKGMTRLRLAADPIYNSLFRQIARHAGGIKSIIDMRADLLRIMRKTESSEERARLKCLNDSMMKMLVEWFNVGFLELKRITWNSPATYLEQVYLNEAVHSVSDWKDLKRRVGEDRMVFAFFHRSLPNIPLVVVHVALTEVLADSVQRIIDEPEERLDMTTIRAANFYSISSTQKGLSGADLGNFLIKRVCMETKKQFPQVDIYSTLSPIPGFRKWLDTQARLSEFDKLASPLLMEDEMHNFQRLKPEAMDGVQAMKSVLMTDDWYQDERTVEVVKPVLMRLCARYLVHERNRKFALDPVANFHVRNGASVYRLNWLGDTSDRGISRSYGLMVNYRYEEEKVELNNERYLLDAHISVGQGIQKLLDKTST
eukprot:CFRG1576T1